MGKLGISIYPNRAPVRRWEEYLELSASYGFSRVFESLIGLSGLSREEIIAKYQPLNLVAQKYGFEVIVDVAPVVLKQVGVTPFDLSFFQELGANGFRLDEGYSGMEESVMTCNPYGLLVEINASIESHYITTILDYQPVRSHLIACHNFYPQRHTGLSIEHFKKTSQRFRELGIRLASFVSSGVENSFGPWPSTDGLPSLECHRDLPIECQVTHLLTMGMDDIIISNCFPTEEELNKVKESYGIIATLDVILDSRTSEIERKILFEELHISRGDVSDKIVRSTLPRVKYAENIIPLFNPKPQIHRGDVIINSEQYENYAGEMHIALCDYPNTGKSNVIGQIRPEELIVLDEIKPWQKFKLRIYHEEDST
jgi:hypothetical protein